MNVYVTNQSNHNMDGAMEFGENIYYLTKGKVNIFRTDDLIDELRLKLVSFQKDDYLVFTGNSVVCGLAISILFTKHKSLKLLLYNGRSMEYVPRQIDRDRLSYEGGE